jgi:hypothetical protein
MAIYIKTGGAWRAAANGALRVRSGGAWYSPAVIYTRYGGGWRDTGYRGYPAVPTGINVYAWDYNQVRIYWAAGAGGATPSGYHIVQTDQSGNWLRQYNVAGSPSPNGYFPVDQDTRYMFYVRAYTPAGLYSGWNGPLRTAIGHAAYSTYATVTATRAYTQPASVVSYRDAPVGPVVPSDVVVQSIVYTISNSGWTSVLSNPASGVHHEIYRWANGGQYERFIWPGASVNTELNLSDYGSNGGVQGMIARGTGMSSTAGGPYVFTGTITVKGTQTYSYVQETVHPAVGNSLW